MTPYIRHSRSDSINGLSEKVGSMNLEDDPEPDENLTLTQGDELRQRKAQRLTRQSKSASSTNANTRYAVYI